MEHHVQAALLAASRGDRLAMEEHVSEGRAGCSDEEGSTPLMYAAASGREEIVELLLRHQVDIDATNVYGWTALMQACCYNHLNSALILLRYKADISLKNNWKTTALVLATQGGYVGIIDALLQKGAEVNQQEVVKALTPLMAAAQCGHESVVSQLLSRGANVHARLESSQLNALMLAAINNQLPVVKLLLKHGAEKEALDINGGKAVDLAAAFKHTAIVQLLDGGRERKVFTKAQLFEAAKSGDIFKVKEILESKREFANSSDKDGFTPLMFAANKGHKEVCQVLLGAGAEVDARDSKNGWTALMLATHKKQYDVVKLLGSRGADVQIKGKTGNTAYDIANMIGDILMIRTITEITIQSLQKGAIPTSLALPAEEGEPGNSTTRKQPGSLEQQPPPGMVDDNRPEDDGPKQDKAEQPPLIDMAKLKRRLQSAYRTTGTPTPSLNIAEKPSSAGNAPHAFRFPMSRVRGLPSSHSRPVPQSAPATPQGSMNSSNSSTASNSSGDGGGGGGRSSPRRPFPRGPGSKSDRLLPPSQALSRSNPNKAAVGKSPGSSPFNRNPLISPQADARFNFPKPGVAAPGSRRVGMVGGVASPTSGSGNRADIQSYLFQKYGGGREVDSQAPPALTRKGSPRSIRSRSSTDPPSMHTPPFKGVPKRKSSLPRYSHIDLRTVLEQADLGRFYSILYEQEIDYPLFLTLTDTEFIEMGVAEEGDRRRLMELIDEINAAPSPGTLKQKSTPVFVYH